MLSWLWKHSPSCYVPIQCDCLPAEGPYSMWLLTGRGPLLNATAYRPRALPYSGPAWTGKYMCSTTTKYNIRAAWADANTYCSARRFVTYSFSLELLVWCMASNKNSEHSYRLDIWLVQQKDKVSGQLELKQIHIALQDSLFLQGLSARVEVEIDM